MQQHRQKENGSCIARFLLHTIVLVLSDRESKLELLQVPGDQRRSCNDLSTCRPLQRSAKAIRRTGNPRFRSQYASVHCARDAKLKTVRQNQIEYNINPGEDAASILSAATDQTRAEIDRERISALQLSQYLFSRQSKLLLLLDQADLVARRGLSLLRTISREMTKYRPDKKAEKLATAWCYTGALTLAESCAQHRVDSQHLHFLQQLFQLALDKVRLHSRVAMLVFMHMLMLKLHVLGESCGLMGNGEPTKFSDDQLNSVLASQQAFDAQYQVCRNRSSC
jgi:hypothetical protein